MICTRKSKCICIHIHVNTHTHRVKGDLLDFLAQQVHVVCKEQRVNVDKKGHKEVKDQ